MSSYMLARPRSLFGQHTGSPFGLGTGITGLFGNTYGAGPRPVVTPPPRPPMYRPPTAPSAAMTNAARFAAMGLTPGGPQQTAPTAKGVDTYDINTDPAYQQAQALIGMSDEQATAAAQKQIKDMLIGYGDPRLAQAILGKGGGDIARAAAANPTSTVAGLGQQRDRNLHTLDDQLNSANLSYSGYRVGQERQAAQDYQNALAQAAAGVQSNIGQIQAALQQALFQNQWQLAQAAQTAAQNAAGTGVDPLASYLSSLLGGSQS